MNHWVIRNLPHYTTSENNFLLILYQWIQAVALKWILTHIPIGIHIKLKLKYYSYSMIILWFIDLYMNKMQYLQQQQILDICI